MTFLGVVMSSWVLADLGTPGRDDDSLVADDMRETNRGYREEPPGFQENPFNWREEPFGYKEKPFGWREFPFGFREEIPGQTSEPAGYREEPLGVNTDENFRIPKENFDSENVADNLREKPPSYLDAHKNATESSGLREKYTGLD